MTSHDRNILKTIKNPTNREYIITHTIPEITFEGGDKKPDFGVMTITYIPNEEIIELKSLKYYFYQFRDKIYSYERLINMVYDDVYKMYKPRQLKVTLDTNPRGGISSHLEVGDID